MSEILIKKKKKKKKKTITTKRAPLLGSEYAITRYSYACCNFFHKFLGNSFRMERFLPLLEVIFMPILTENWSLHAIENRYIHSVNLLVLASKRDMA